MIIVHTILSTFKVEATLYNLLGVFLGAEDFFKDFKKQPYPNTQEEKLKTLTQELSKQFEESHKLEEEICKNLEMIGYEF